MFDSLLKEVQELRLKKTELTKLRKEMLVKHKSLSAEIKKYFEEIDKLRKIRDDYNIKVKENKKKRDELNSQYNSTLSSVSKLQEELKQFPKELESYNILKTKIDSLEWKLQTEVANLKEENKIVTVVKDLKKNLDESKKRHNFLSELKRLQSSMRDSRKQTQLSHQLVLNYATESENTHLAIQSVFNQVTEAKSKRDHYSSLLDANQLEINNIRKSLKDKTESARKNRTERTSSHELKVKKALESKFAEAMKKLEDKRKLTTEDLLVIGRMDRLSE